MPQPEALFTPVQYQSQQHQQQQQQQQQQFQQQQFQQQQQFHQQQQHLQPTRIIDQEEESKLLQEANEALQQDGVWDSYCAPGQQQQGQEDVIEKPCVEMFNPALRVLGRGSFGRVSSCLLCLYTYSKPSLSCKHNVREENV